MHISLEIFISSQLRTHCARTHNLPYDLAKAIPDNCTVNEKNAYTCTFNGVGMFLFHFHFDFTIRMHSTAQRTAHTHTRIVGQLI